MIIEINDIKISVNINAEGVNEEGFKELEVDFMANNETEYHLYKTLTGLKKLNVKLPMEEQGFVADIKRSSFKYQDESFNGSSFSLKLVEVGPDEKEWSVQTGLSLFALQSITRIDALKELLVEKEIITAEEIDNKFQEVFERDYQKRYNFLFTGDKNNNKYAFDEEEDSE